MRSQAGWLRFVPRQLRFVLRQIRVPAADLWTDPAWIVESTPVECARSRPTARRPNLAGYGCCAQTSRHPTAKYSWTAKLRNAALRMSAR